jgi:hypothetical protein
MSTNALPSVPPALPCSDCKEVMRMSYFALEGRPLCAKCRMPYQQKVQFGTGPAAMRRAVLYGAAAATVGAIVLGIVVLAFGFGRVPLSIGIAYLVAKAIGKATGDYGGRRYQILAVCLTYFAIGFGSIAPAVRAAREYRHVGAAPKRDLRTGPQGEMTAIEEEMHDPNNPMFALANQGLDSAEIAARRDSLVKAEAVSRLERSREAFKARSAENAQGARLSGGFVKILVGTVILLVTLPLLSLFAYGIYGAVVGVLALGYGMRKAWQLTELAVDWKVTGPFRVGMGPIKPTIGV